MTRDPGDDLWSQTFDWLAPEPLLAHLNADTKGDFLELTLAAAAQVLACAEKPCSQPLMRCLHAARLLIEDAARTLEELQLWDLRTGALTSVRPLATEAPPGPPHRRNAFRHDLSHAFLSPLLNRSPPCAASPWQLRLLRDLHKAC